MSEDEQQRKESGVFDLAIEQLCGFWTDKTYDSFPILAKGVKCIGASERYGDNIILDEYVKASSQKVRESNQLKELTD